jgi:16S rRNA (cytidine1402-2'-O)-methyltransferase
MKSTGTLHVVGTPIGNVRDVGQRACEVLAAVDLIAAEDTRRTRGLLSHIGVEARVMAYHEHNEDTRAAVLIERLEAGSDIALVSDAGTPLISDPGWRLVHKALGAGIAVRCVPGPSAVTCALSIAGQPTDRFAFEGFLPRRPRQRAERLRALAAEERTLVFFEAVHRLESTVQALVEAFGPERPATIARELTKLHEQIATGTLAELAARLGGDIPLLGEFVLIVQGNASPSAAAEGEVARVYGLLSAELAPDRAVALCAEILGLARNDVYRLTRT